MDTRSIRMIASRLIDAQNRASKIQPMAATTPGFDVEAAYEVLHEIEGQRVKHGWRPVGYKIGFTNRTIWQRYGVNQPMGAHVWSHTVRHAMDGTATQPLAGFVQPRIEPEVVFKLDAPVMEGADAQAVLAATQWIAAGFEIVQSHFPDWKFTAADCTAAFGLHAALVVGEPLMVDAANREAIATLLPAFHIQLKKGDSIVDRGVGEHVLGSPALAVAHLAAVLARRPKLGALEAGTIVTTGTLTDAWPVTSGESWSSDYGELPVRGLTLRLT